MVQVSCSNCISIVNEVQSSRDKNKKIFQVKTKQFGSLNRDSGKQNCICKSRHKSSHNKLILFLKNKMSKQFIQGRKQISDFCLKFIFCHLVTEDRIPIPLVSTYSPKKIPRILSTSIRILKFKNSNSKEYVSLSCCCY